MVCLFRGRRGVVGVARGLGEVEGGQGDIERVDFLDWVDGRAFLFGETYIFFVRHLQ